MVLVFHKLSRMLAVIALVMAWMAPLRAQQTTPPAPPLAHPSAAQAQSAAPLAVPQVNSVAHRLNGLKVLNLLRRNGMKVAPLSDETLMADEVQTSITAGLSLGDGSIVARLPRAELEISAMSTSTFFARTIATKPVETPVTLFVIDGDGGELPLRFMGLDGGTGLSLLSADSTRLATAARDAKEESLELGQRVRVISPVSVPQPAGLTSNGVFVNTEVLEGKLTEISRGLFGKVTRLTIKAPQLSASAIGGVAVNDAGEIIGLVDSSNGDEAQIIPVAGVRRAVDRIRLGLANKPRPWLGARGTSVAIATREQLELSGWKRAEAASLIATQIGVVLTVVPPQTPASVAKLRVGDVVTRINGGEVRSAEEFSSLLNQAGTKSPVRFTIVRPARTRPHVVYVNLNVSLNPVLEMEVAEQRAFRLTSSDPLVARGMETLPMTTELATRLKARGGLFVVFVHPDSGASRAGLLAGDIIESLNSELLSDANRPASLPNTFSLGVVRNGQRLEFQVESEISAPPQSQQ